MNENEAAVKEKLERHGFSVLRNGWPDFLCTRFLEFGCKTPRNLGVMAVEVKAKGDSISATQAAVHKVLRAVRIPVYVVRPEDDDLPEIKARHILSESQKQALKNEVSRLASDITTMQRRLAYLMDVTEGTAQLAQDQTPLLQVWREDHGRGIELIDNPRPSITTGY